MVVKLTTQKGRARHQALFDFLGRYPMATTEQLTALIWGGNARLARAHLLRFVREGLLRRLPHPLYRNRSYVYTLSTARGTTHSQKVLHHLQMVDFHVAVVRTLCRHGARITPELPWAPGLVPDQTVWWPKGMVWAVEYHLTGVFSHAADYQRLMEEETYTLCHWWREGIRPGLLVVTAPAMLEHVRGQLCLRDPPSPIWRVATKESAMSDPGSWVK